MRRLRLVQLPVPQPAAYAATGNVPLAAGCLGVAARVHGLGGALALDVLAPEATDVLGDTRLADRISRDEPEFLGLSLYLWNVERSLHLAREVKRRSPRTTVLVGGPEVSPDNAFVLGQGGFDVAVTGEAEPIFGPLMRRLLDPLLDALAALNADRAIEPSAWDELKTRADPESVTFADRRLERAWQRRVLGYEELVAPDAAALAS
jgi:hypothetical protein